MLTKSQYQSLEQQHTAEKRKQEETKAQAVLNRKKQFKHGYAVAVVGAVVGGGVTLLVEHYDRIINFVFQVLAP